MTNFSWQTLQLNPLNEDSVNKVGDGLDFIDAITGVVNDVSVDIFTLACWWLSIVTMEFKSNPLEIGFLSRDPTSKDRKGRCIVDDV